MIMIIKWVVPHLPYIKGLHLECTLCHMIWVHGVKSIFGVCTVTCISLSNLHSALMNI